MATQVFVLMRYDTPIMTITDEEQAHRIYRALMTNDNLVLRAVPLDPYKAWLEAHPELTPWVVGLRRWGIDSVAAQIMYCHPSFEPQTLLATEARYTQAKWHTAEEVMLVTYVAATSHEAAQHIALARADWILAHDLWPNQLSPDYAMTGNRGRIMLADNVP
jgi:hypothetical protein